MAEKTLKKDSTAKAANLLRCPSCGNTQTFLEIDDDVVTTTHYAQNPDGSFHLEERDFHSLGTPKLLCNNCEEEMTEQHYHQFSKMIF